MINFKPFVGDNYETGGILKLRTLVLGESHYSESDNINSDLTIKVVDKLGINKRHSFFTRVTKTLLGYTTKNNLTREEKYSLWHSVSFYNYIQEIVGSGPRIRPSEKMWLDAQEPFKLTLKELNPSVVVVLGKQLWRYLPQPSMEIQTENQVFKVYENKYHKQILAGYINHPSSAKFNHNESNYRVSELFIEGNRRNNALN